jgi:hypothetical protein
VYAAADHSDPKARPNYDLYWMNVEEFLKSQKAANNQRFTPESVGIVPTNSRFSTVSDPIPYPFRTVAAQEVEKKKPVRITFVVHFISRKKTTAEWSCRSSRAQHSG